MMQNDDIKKHLQQIYDEHGRLTPQLVVTLATEPSHPLHPLLTWDDAAAAHQRRLDQAHGLIRTCRVTYKNPEISPAERSVRAFHAVRRAPETENRGFVYEPTDVVVADPIKVAAVLADMQREWQALKRRYEQFKEFWELVEKDRP